MALSDDEKRMVIDTCEEIFLDFDAETKNPMRQVLHRTWLRNILYYLGEQWISWYEAAGGTGKFGRRYQIQMSLPTPVSNIIRDYVKAQRALTLNRKHVSKVWPNSDEQEDKDAAEIGWKVLTNLDLQNDGEAKAVRGDVELWRIITGNAFARVGEDRDAAEFITRDGGTIAAPSKVIVECIPPFFVEVPMIGGDLRRKSYVGIKQVVSKEWVEDTWGVKVEIPEDTRIVEYQKMLMTMVAEVSPWKGRGLDFGFVSTEETKDLCILKEVEKRPTRRKPKGEYFAMAGDTPLEYKDEMSIPVDDKGGWGYSLTHFRFNGTPGGFWACGGVDDIISPQNTINEVDQGLAVNRKSLGRPYVLTPSELVLKRISDRGQALLALSYDARSAGGAKPEVHAGTPYPQQVLEERAIHKETAQDSAGDPKHILRGQAPTSGASGIMVDILREAAEQSHAPDIEGFYLKWQEVDKKRLLLVQKIYKETRMLKVPGRGNEIKVMAFKGADLRGNTDVQLEPDSGASTSQAGRNQILLDLVKGGFWGGILDARPDIQREILKRLGLGGFPEEMNLHMQRAEYENSILLSSKVEIDDPILKTVALPVDAGMDVKIFPRTFDPAFRIDDHGVHIRVHDKAILSPEFRTVPRHKQILLVAHRDLHAAAIEAERDAAVQDNIIKAAEASAMGVANPENVIGMGTPTTLPSPGSNMQGGGYGGAAPAPGPRLGGNGGMSGVGVGPQ